MPGEPLRLRITFSKTGAARYSGHLDLHKTWERSLRRAGLPLAYSQGFNPQPKIQLASALPLGFTSECEVADIWLERDAPPDEVAAALARALPPGLAVSAVERVDERLPALQTQLAAAEYNLEVESAVPPEEIDARIEALLLAKSLPRERRGKPYDLRPLVESLVRCASDGMGHTLAVRLRARQGEAGRPDEVLAALGLAGAPAVIHRTRLHFIDNTAG